VLSLTLFDLICLKNSDEHFTPLHGRIKTPQRQIIKL